MKKAKQIEQIQLHLKDYFKEIKSGTPDRISFEWKYGIFSFTFSSTLKIVYISVFGDKENFLPVFIMGQLNQIEE